ncbi:threonine synthase [Candidatus Poribacteria bacterium]|nr:threonine synthase [Candidatus Poribacteria bacterium]MBT5710153.1 threonine synthase [Candidatus Poribacteria bacterium]
MGSCVLRRVNHWRTTMVHFDMLCDECRSRFTPDPMRYGCDCGSALDFAAPAPPIAVEELASRPANMWRYHEALRIARPEDAVTMGEGMTPLIRADRSDHDLRLKLDFTFPTGSYKDRGAAVLISALREMGADAVVEDSSGNAGAAIAAYAARAGMRCVIYTPSGTSPAKLDQIRVFGAELRLVEGDRQATTEAVLEAAETTPYASHNWTPYFITGVKTVAFEIAEQLGWRAPDNVVAPAGFGSILLGLHLGFSELRRHGITDTTPRLLAAQAERCCPIHVAWRAGADVVDRFVDPRPTLAEGIASTRPIRARQVLDAIRHTEGAVATVTEDEIADGVRALAREGIYVEPTSAVVVSAFDRLVEQGVIRDGDLTVSILTGSGLKASGKVPA